MQNPTKLSFIRTFNSHLFYDNAPDPQLLDEPKRPDGSGRPVKLSLSMILDLRLLPIWHDNSTSSKVLGTLRFSSENLQRPASPSLYNRGEAQCVFHASAQKGLVCIGSPLVHDEWMLCPSK
jgi:hypothetical protein